MKKLLFVLTLVVGLCATQAFAALEGIKDSADFDFKYEMDVDPDTQNLDSAGGGLADWGDYGNDTETYDGLCNFNQEWYEYHGGSGNGDIFDNPTLDGYNNGFTMEIRLKLDIVSTFDLFVQTGTVADSDIRIEIEDTAVHYESSSTGRTNLSTANTQGEWHTYRLASPAYTTAINTWYFWMDDNLLMDGVDLGTSSEAARALTIGNVYDIDCQGQLDYFRITSGAWDVPEPATLAILGIGAALALLRRRRA